MTSNFANAGIFLVQAIVGIYLILMILRFLMQVSRVDYYNPLCQSIVKLTDPLVKPLKTVLPTVRGVDFATLLVAILVQLVLICIVVALLGGPIFHPAYIAWAFVGVTATLFDVYFFSLIIMVIGSFIAPYSTHPAMTLVQQLTEPLCAPARKLLPPMGGLDFSIMLVFLSLAVLDSYLLIPPLANMLQIPPGVIPGLY